MTSRKIIFSNCRQRIQPYGKKKIIIRKNINGYTPSKPTNSLLNLISPFQSNQHFVYFYLISKRSNLTVAFCCAKRCRSILLVDSNARCSNDAEFLSAQFLEISQQLLAQLLTLLLNVVARSKLENLFVGNAIFVIVGRLLILKLFSALAHHLHYRLHNQILTNICSSVRNDSTCPPLQQTSEHATSEPSGVLTILEVRDEMLLDKSPSCWVSEL